MNVLITPKLNKFKKNIENLFFKFGAFSVVFKDLCGKCKATCTVIKALLTQKLQKLKWKINHFFKKFKAFSIVFDYFEALLKQLALLLTCS